MIFEILIIISAAAIFVILAKRLPETNQVADAPINSELKSSKLDFGNFTVPLKKIFVGIPRLSKIKFDWAIKLFKRNRGAGERPILTKKFLDNAQSFKTIKDLLNEANDFFSQGDFKSAEKLYLKIASKDPRSSIIYSRLGAIYLQQKNFADARDAFLAAIDIDNKVASRHYNLALSYIGLSTLLKAKVSLKKAIDLDSKEKYKKLLEKIEEKSK